MKKRATNLLMTGVMGSAMAGMLVAGVAAASHDDGLEQAPAKKPIAAQAGDTTANGTQKAGAAPKAKDKKDKKKVLYSGTTTASYFWDDGSGVNGDTGMPASGKPMQEGLFASPSWPLNTKVKVTYDGRSAVGFIGDRGPGEPSHRGVMLDLDTYTFRHLVDGGKPKSDYNTGTDQGHLKGVKYEILKWGKGDGVKGKPQPFGDGS